MIEITLKPKMSQRISLNLGSQDCDIRMIQYKEFIYMDLIVDGKQIMQGVPCLNANRMVRYEYLGFKGELIFLDLQGSEHPNYTGLGGRFKLYYLSEEENAV